MKRWRDHGIVFAVFLVFSALWSWPTARMDPGLLITRHFDLYPTVWAIEVAPTSFLSLRHASSGWPEGETLERADSFVLLLISWFLGGKIAAGTVASLFAWVGPAINAFAAERCAGDGWGVRRPWSLMAGLVYGFSGIASVALLEGHPWYVLQPWLPLIAWSWVRSADADEPWRWGVVMGLAWAASLLTSAYFGIFGLILVGVLCASHPKRAFLIAGGLAGSALPIGLLYSWIFFQGGRWAQPAATGTEMLLRMGSTTLAGLAGWSNAADLTDHSLCAPVGWMGFGLLLFAPLALRNERGWRALFALALFSLVAMLGRTVRSDLGSPLFDWPIDRFITLPGLSFFRFPIRFGWLYALATALVSARVLEVLSRALPRRALVPVLVLAGLDAIVGIALPWRLRGVPATAPSAYQLAPASAAILDLFGRPVHHSGELEMWAQNLACFYQASHHRPILDVCLGTMITSPRPVVDRWLTRAVLQNPPPAGVVERLGGLGVGAVALHSDWYRPNDRDALKAGLISLLGEPLGETSDGGERLVVWKVPEVSNADPMRAWELIRKEVF